ERGALHGGHAHRGDGVRGALSPAPRAARLGGDRRLRALVGRAARGLARRTRRLTRLGPSSSASRTVRNDYTGADHVANRRTDRYERQDPGPGWHYGGRHAAHHPRNGLCPPPFRAVSLQPCRPIVALRGTAGAV